MFKKYASSLTSAVLGLLSVSYGNASTLDLFGVPNDLLCPDLFRADATIEDRLFEAYTRVLENYRETVSEEEFLGILQNILSHHDYYTFPRGELATHPASDLFMKIGLVVKKNEFQNGERLEADHFAKRIKKYLEETIENSRSASRLVEKSTEKTVEARLPSTILRGHQKRVTTFIYSPDSKLGLSGGRDGALILWDLKSKKSVFRMQMDSGIELIRVDTGFKKALSVSDTGELTLWDLEQGKAIRTLSEPIMASHLQVNADFTRAIAPTTHSRCILWNLETGEAVHTFSLPDHGWLAKAVQVNSDFSSAVVLSYHSTFFLDLQTGKMTKRPPLEKKTWMAFDSELGRAVTVDGRKISISELQTGKVIRHLDGATEFLAASPDFTKALVQSESGLTLQYLDIKKEVHFLGPKEWLQHSAVNWDSRRVIGFFLDRAILWDLETGDVLHTLRAPDGFQMPFAVSSDLSYAVAASKTGWLNYWDIEKETKIETLGRMPFQIHGTSNLNRLISGSEDGTLSLWELDQIRKWGGF